MKKFNLVFALFCALFFAVSCDSGIKFNNPNDIHSDAYDPEASKSGENETNDEDIDQAVTDPTDNEPTDTEPDDSDTTLEQPDNGDSEPDESDTTDDGDSSAPDEDADEQDEEPATRTATCSGLPANASWHNGSSITQTFDGNDWYPPATGFYSETAVENECGFKCNQGYEWNGNQCVKPATPCNPNPCTSISNSTGNCTVNGTGYICGCQSGYEWSGNLCIMTAEEECNVAGGNWNASQNECTKTANCPSKPANTVWNDNGANGTYTQTWSSSSGWSSYSSTYNATTSGTCRYKCASGYDWNGNYCTDSTVSSSLTLGNICTGQTSCYNRSSSITCPTSPSGTGDEYNFFGQDAQYTSACTAQSFSASSDVVVDNNTGLTWEKSPSSGTYKWIDRATHCNELNSSNYGGKSNWRVPTPLELLTIVNNQTYNPATNSNFTGMPTVSSDNLWTSKQYNTDNAYYFSPYYGYEPYTAKTKTYKVICVSGDEMPKGVFTTQTISGSIVVTDSTTGLMWQKEYVTGKTWQQALKYCEDSTYAGYSDWRLPNKNELASLLNHDKSSAPYSDFPDMPSNWFCSSSTHVINTIYAWYVDFNDGLVRSYSKNFNYYVRCVR